MIPSLRSLFMKKLTRERVVPIISASVSWLIFCDDRLGAAFLAEIRKQSNCDFGRRLGSRSCFRRDHGDGDGWSEVHGSGADRDH